MSSEYDDLRRSNRDKSVPQTTRAQSPDPWAQARDDVAAERARRERDRQDEILAQATAQRENARRSVYVDSMGNLFNQFWEVVRHYRPQIGSGRVDLGASAVSQEVRSDGHIDLFFDDGIFTSSDGFWYLSNHYDAEYVSDSRWIVYFGYDKSAYTGKVRLVVGENIDSQYAGYERSVRAKLAAWLQYYRLPLPS